jgi:Fic family protein
MALTRTPEDTEAKAQVMRHLTRRIQGEYAEMPGLSITLGQAQRLLAIDETTCTAVFRTLIKRGVLRRTTDGRYVRAQ